MYRVEVDWAPPYELLASLKAYAHRPEHKTLDLGLAWVKSTRQRLSSDLAAELSAPGILDHVGLVDLLIWQCPADRSIDGFLHWLAGLSGGELYERLAPHVAGLPKPLPDNLAAFRDRWVRTLTRWNQQYFGSLDPAILAGLAADAERQRALIGTLPPEELVERATKGVHFTPEPEPDLVLLVPQYHYRPWNLFDNYRDIRRIEYPVEALPLGPGEPPRELLRLTRALADESRLRILRLLAEGPRSFTELVKATGLSKSTVHHHMVQLRAAGLVRVRETGDMAGTYLLRAGAARVVGELVRSYLEPEDKA